MTELSSIHTSKVARVDGKFCHPTCEHLADFSSNSEMKHCILAGRILIHHDKQYHRCMSCLLTFGVPVQFAGRETLTSP